MMKRCLQIVFVMMILLTSPSKSNAAILTGFHDFNPGFAVSLDGVMVNTDANLVDIRMSGRADGWFGVGFGSNIMANTYGIIVHNDGLIEERRLNYAGGSVLDNQLTVISSEVVGNVRSVHVRRARDVQMSDYFTFPDVESDVQLIGATAPGSYGYHAGTRGPGTLSLSVSAIPEPNASFCCLLISTVWFSFRRRRLAS